MLRLSETNCDSKSHNLTLALKDRRGLLPGQEVALMTVLAFAGAVGLTCAGLVIFNWKLQQCRGNEHTSKNLCCRTLNESPCTHEERNGCAGGCCNCHITRENETEVMSHVGLRKEIPLRDEKRHQATLASTSTALDTSFRKLKGRDRGPDRACSRLGDALLPARCLGSSGNKKALHDASLVTRCLTTAEKLSNPKHREVQAQILLQHGTRKIDMSSSNTFRSRYVTSTSALARESLGKHLTDKSWQPPIGTGDNAAQPPGQRLFITSPSSRPWEPEECAVGRISHTHRVGYDDHCGLLKQNKPMDFHPSTSFTCKYVSWDGFEDYMREEKPVHREHVKSEKEQIQINRAITKFLRSRENKDKSKLSAKIKKAYATKRVKVHDPDLVRGNSLPMSAKTPASGRQLESENHYPTSLDLKNCASLEKVKESREWFPEQQFLKKKRLKQSHPSKKVKGRSLRIKLDLHPFGKARVHPEESPQELPKIHKQTGLPAKKLARTSERKFKAAPLSFVSSQLPDRSSHAKFTCSRMSLESAPQQTPYQERNGLHRADSLCVGNLGSVQSGCCPVGHVPNGSPSTVLQPITRVLEQQCLHPLFSPAQMENVTQLQIEAMGPSQAHLGNVEDIVLSSQHSRGAIGHVMMVSTQYMDQDKLKTNELNQFTLSLSDQVADNFSRDHSLGNNQALQQEEQQLSHEQLGSEEKPLVSKSKLSHEHVKSCVMDGEGTDGGKKIPPCIEDCDSSPTAWTQPHDNLPFVMPHSVPHPKGTELIKEICAPPTRSQALGHLRKSSKGGIGTHAALPGDKHGEAPGTQAVGKEQKQALDERKAHSSAVSWETLLGTPGERQQPREGEGKEKLALCNPGSDKKIVSTEDLSPVKTIMLQSEIEPHTLNCESHCRDPGDNRPEVSAHRDDAGAVGLPGAPYLFGELNITHFEAENGVPLIPYRENRTENTAYKPSSTEDSVPPLSEAE